MFGVPEFKGTRVWEVLGLWCWVLYFLYLVLPNYYILEINFFWLCQYCGSCSFCRYSVYSKKRLPPPPCQLDKKNYFKKLKYDPFKLFKISFSKFFSFKCSRGGFLTHCHCAAEAIFCCPTENSHYLKS